MAQWMDPSKSAEVGGRQALTSPLRGTTCIRARALEITVATGDLKTQTILTDNSIEVGLGSQGEKSNAVST